MHHFETALHAYFGLFYMMIVGGNFLSKKLGFSPAVPKNFDIFSDHFNLKYFLMTFYFAAIGCILCQLALMGICSVLKRIMKFKGQ